MRRIHLPALVVFACVAPFLHADESLAPAVLKDIKNATVFVKVDAGALKMSGSGFLIKLAGGAGYIVTNNHVIDTSGPHVVQSDPHHRRTISTNRVPDITAVFSSGTPDELSLPAQVMVADKDRDLAILLVKGITRQIKPIDLNVPADLVETTPIFVFGFPFGESLSIEGHNPAITVGRGAISSVRLNQKREVAAVQIDGALNPGNSGGPVVDAKGRLAGVAVATIVGSGIGLAIPPSEVKQELAGRLGIAQVVASRAATKKNLFTAHVTVAVIDPMSQIRSVTFCWVPASAAERLKPESHLSDLPTAHKVLLKMEGAEASGTFDVPAPATGPTDIVYEASYISGAKVSYSTRNPISLGDAALATAQPAPNVPLPAGPASVTKGHALPASAGAAEYINAALAALASEDGRTQTSGADQLRIAPLDEAHRSAVLAALALHLASVDQGLRVASVRAYAHWATAKEAPVLAKVAEKTEEAFVAAANSRFGWAAAMVGLVRLDPAAAERVYAARKGDFLFSTTTSEALMKLAEDDPPYAGEALRLLREFDSIHPKIRMSVPEAMQLLESDAASARADGCDGLMIAPIDPQQRPRILTLLAAHLNAVDGAARLKYVRAYARWSDASNLKDLQAIVDFPKTGPMNDHDRSWTAAVIAMVRLLEAPAAVESYNSRADAFWFHSSFTTTLREFAERTGPEQALAWSLLEQLNHGAGTRLHPVDAGAVRPPAPLAPIAETPPTPAPDTAVAKKPDVANKPLAEAPAPPLPGGALHGQIRGNAFVPDRIEMQSGWLIIRSGKEFFPEKEIKIAFRIRPGEPISGRKYHVDLGDRQKPAIFVSRMQPGDKLPQAIVAQRYQMDIEFGQLANDKLPGKIKLVVEDEQGINLTGSFVAKFK